MLSQKHDLWGPYVLDEKLSYGKRSVIWRAHREDSKDPVILKLTTDENPKNIAHLKHEYNLLNKLKDVQGIIHPIDEIYQDNRYGIIFPDNNQIPLSKIIKKQKLTLAQLLSIMINMVSTIKKIHELGVIHKDIKPNNILIDKNNAVTLLDFGIAAEISREPQIEELPGKLEGTLAYISPEQTGRMNRVIDIRSDLYSLGVTFYEMLTGELPFIAADALTLIEAHMTKIPKTPHEINSHVPEVLSQLIMILMNKQVSDRYQTAYTLEKDLNHCFEEWNKQRAIKNFPLRQHDIPAQLTLPQKLYGRDIELNKILNIYNKVTQGQLEILMLTGDPGVGKTELINECRVKLLNQGAIFIRGKFEQFKKDQALQALTQAFNEFALQLMALPEDQFQEWRDKLIKAVGPNGKIITDLVPNFTKIIGPQPELQEIDLNQSFNRIVYTLQSFIQAIATKEHPLVIFLDDVQWADNVTLNWLKEIVMPSLHKLHHVMLIGAYRHEEEGVEQLSYTLNVMQDFQAIEFLHVTSLREETVAAWLIDALYLNKYEIDNLPQIFYEKTHGNPFHMTALLNSLYIDKIIMFNHLEGKWVWDIESLKKANARKNVAELMHYFLKNLPADTQHLLQYAACIGHKFSLAELSYVMGKPQAEIAQQLWLALKQNIIIPLSSNYRFADVQINNSDFEVYYQFAHDKIQQTAYHLLSNQERMQTHYQTAKYLDECVQEDTRQENIVSIVNHYNHAISLITDEKEKLHVAELNLQAASRAKSSTNFLDGAQFADIGIELLPLNYWQSYYQLAFSLLKLRAECEFATANYTKAVEDVKSLLIHSKTVLDKMQIYYLYTMINTARGNLQEAITQMINGMRLGGFKIQRHPNIFHVIKTFLQYWWHFRKIKIDSLANRPPSDSPEVTWTIKLFHAGGVALYETDSVNLTLIFILNSLMYLEEKGITPFSSFPCGAASYLFGGILGYYKHAHEWAELAKKISERYNDPLMRALFLQVYLHFDYWRQTEFTLTKWCELAQEGMQYAQQAGSNVLTIDMLSMSAPQKAPLEEQIKYVNSTVPIIKSMKIKSMLERYLRFFSLKFNEAGKTLNPNSMSFPDFDSVLCYKNWQREKNNLQLSCCDIVKATIAYRNQNYQEFYKHYILTKGYFSFAERVEDTYIYAPVSFSHLKLKQKFGILGHIWSEYKFIKKLAKYNPTDFLAYYHYMRAELFRCLGFKRKATKLYTLALQEMEMNLANDKITADKLAIMLQAVGEYYYVNNDKTLATEYLQKAYKIYDEKGFVVSKKILRDRYDFIK